jgi:DNA-binding transcriptional ArsR family regulator
MVDLKPNPALDAVFASLADPTRRAIVDRLGQGEATISQLADPFSMSLQAVSKHLAVLEQAGLIAVEKRGRSRHTRLQPQPLAAASAWLERYREFWEGRLDALADYLEKPSPSTPTASKRGVTRPKSKPRKRSPRRD